MDSSQAGYQRHRDSATSKTGRRQHRSCDQCRKGKRACDLVILNDDSPNKERYDALPCSNCARTSKKCTIEWLQAMHEISTRRQKNAGRWNPVLRQTQSLSKAQAPENSKGSHRADGITSLQFYDEICRGPPISPEAHVAPCDDIGSNDLCQQDKAIVDYNQGASVLDYEAGNTFSELDGEFQLNSSPKHLEVPFHTVNTCVGTAATQSLISSGKCFGNSGLYSSYPESTSTQSTSYDFDLLSDPSPASLQQRLADSTTHSFLTGGLIRIYHDSMENALSCWLTERNCPYSLASKSRLRITAQESMSTEWGPNWSNRICARVCRLDRVSSKLTSQPKTKAQDRAASRALHTAIMSFATQWAQTSQRSTIDFSSFTASNHESGSSYFGTPYETGSPNHASGRPCLDDANFFSQAQFDRSIQETTWHQARKALQDAAEIESFQVIFAHIIFSLTQRPLDVDHQIRNMKTRRRRRSSSQSTFPVDINEGSELDKILEADGPPIFLETALRQLHSYRCKLERIERERAIQLKKMNYSSSLPTRADPLNEADRGTFNLLFWLGIMFDTLSSAMNQRPLVVSDKDSDILQQQSPEGGFQTGVVSEKHNFLSKAYTVSDTVLLDRERSLIWGKFFLDDKHTMEIRSKARWPCSYEEAAATLCDAAPVKVLLFRKVTHLQSLLSRRSGSQDLEEAIHDALKVYQHWNKVYGQFILDCVSHHNNLPPRIQSWYVILAGHWHLGALLLADIIEIIDEGKLGSATQRNCRHLSGLVTKMRRQNTYAISDLAECSSPNEDASFPNGPEFHFALNKGALLTEPWTVVLIRAFGKAGSLLLDGMTPTNSNDFEQTRAKCEHCLQALWHLGKKSDMAFLAATALSVTLKEKTSLSYFACCAPGTELSSEMAASAWDNAEFGERMIPESFDLDLSCMGTRQPYQADTVFWMD